LDKIITSIHTDSNKKDGEKKFLKSKLNINIDNYCFNTAHPSNQSKKYFVGYTPVARKHRSYKQVK